MIMSERMYNVLKYIQRFALPAIGTFYATIAGIWGFPYSEAILGTLTAVTVLLGALLQKSYTAYTSLFEMYAETVEAEEDEDSDYDVVEDPEA